MSDSYGKHARPAASTPAAGEKCPSSSDAAFDLWLHRGLQTIYGDVANEPIPAELMALIEARKEMPPASVEPIRLGSAEKSPRTPTQPFPIGE